MYGWTKEQTDEFLLMAVKLCADLKINAVAGPVMSGAVMASSIATAASHVGMGVTAILLDKPITDGRVNYRPTKHSGGIKQLYLLTSGTELRIMLVDDVVSSGLSMGHAIAEIQRGFVTSTIVAAVSGNGWYGSVGKFMKDKVPGLRLFSVWGKDGSLREFKNGEPINI